MAKQQTGRSGGVREDNLKAKGVRQKEKSSPNPWRPHIVRLKAVRPLGELVRLRGLIAGLLRVGLGHVLALLGIAVIAATFLVIDAAVGVDPNHALLRRRASGGCGGRGSLAGVCSCLLGVLGRCLGGVSGGGGTLVGRLGRILGGFFGSLGCCLGSVSGGGLVGVGLRLLRGRLGGGGIGGRGSRGRGLGHDLTPPQRQCQSNDCENQQLFFLHGSGSPVVAAVRAALPGKGVQPQQRSGVAKWCIAWTAESYTAVD